MKPWCLYFHDDLVAGLEDVDAGKPLPETDVVVGHVEMSELFEDLVDLFLQTRDLGKGGATLDHAASRRDSLEVNTTAPEASTKGDFQGATAAWRR